MSRQKGPRYYRARKPTSHYIQQAVALLQEYPEVVASYHVLQSEEGVRMLAFNLRLPSGDVAPVQLRPEVEGVRERLARVDGDHADPATVAWAQLHALLELQLEAVASGAARASNVFGGSMLTSGDQTVGEAIEGGGADLLEGQTPLLGSG